jgi:DNA-binding NarL/FixJ family response regulator
MEEKYRIVIAEDQRIVREGLRALLENSPDLEVVGEAGDGLEAMRCVQAIKPDMILLDLSMPRMDGLSALREIKRRSPETRILLLTIHDTEEYIVKAFQLGASGYCLKDAARSELLIAVRSVLAGKPYLSPGISGKVVTGYLMGRKNQEAPPSKDPLTHREREVLKLIGEGYKNKEIADFLYVSPKTVEKHRANIMKKLDLHNASALTAYAIKEGMVNR